MSILAVVVLLFLFMKNTNLSSTLKNVDIDGIKETLKSLGVENSFFDAVSNETVEKVLSGDIKALLPLLPTILSLFNKGNNASASSFNSSVTAEEFEPIKDIASESILSTLGSYFT